MIYIGIDPGLNGAVAALPVTGDPLGVWDTPTLLVKKGAKVRQEYQPLLMLEILRNLLKKEKDLLVGLEFVHAMPGCGTVAANSMGYCTGLWVMACAALNVPHVLIAPQQWKKEVIGIRTGDNKQASILQAQRLFPCLVSQLSRKKDDGRAEAVLIAEYVRRKKL